MVSIDINASLLWQIANFIILIFVLNVVLYKPIRGILKERAAKFAQLNGEINAGVEGAAARAKELEDRRTESRRLGAQIREELKNEGRSKERELVQAATKEMEATVAKVRAEVAGEIGKAREELKAQVQSFGVELAQKILGRSIQ
jgi:F-type H+-transporting ATPase subunit b